MIIGNRDANQIVTKLQSEFSHAQVLFMLPAGRVGIGGQAREPVGEFVNVVLILAEILGPSSRHDECGIVDRIVPPNRKVSGLTRGQRLGEVDAHHGLDDRVRKRIAARILDFSHLHPAIENSFKSESLHGLEFNFVEGGSRGRQASIRILGKYVGVELEPKIAERIRRLVRVGYRLRPNQSLLLVVDLDIDVVVHFCCQYLGPGAPEAVRVSPGVGRTSSSCRNLSSWPYLEFLTACAWREDGQRTAMTMKVKGQAVRISMRISLDGFLVRFR